MDTILSANLKSGLGKGAACSKRDTPIRALFVRNNKVDERKDGLIEFDKNYSGD